jgi:DNA-binding protein YbaB
VYEPGEHDAEEGERMLTWLETAQEDLDRIIGAGEAASGQVKATVDANGLVLDVAYGPHALRLGSAELAEQTLVAVRAAGADAVRKTHDLMREALPGYDPATAGAELERILKDWN